jgi:LPXTG-motif cell wall-anchored protein
MAKRLLIVATLAALLHAAPASGQQYPPGDNELVTLSDTTVVPGQEITITASGFAPAADVTATFASQPVVIARGTADASGTATMTGTIPADATPGSHSITVSGQGADGSPRELTASLVVLGPGGGAGAGLPRTGTSTLPLTGVAAALLGVGAAFFLTARRRRAKAVTAADD